MLVAISMDAGSRATELDADRWVRIRHVFEKAIELAPDARVSYLDEACAGDAALRAEVVSLLAAATGSQWIDRPIVLDPPGEAAGSDDSAETAPLAPGRRLGPYRIVEKIGEGGMGAVYRAIDERLNRDVAIKVISRLRGSGGERRRFFLEAKAASALNHPNIVTIYEYDAKEGLDYMVMEYIQGPTLDRLIAGRQTPLPELLGYAREAAGAVQKAHRAGIVHRDLKPKNIMITLDGTVKVLDFGLAKQTADAGGPELAQTLTCSGILIGTPAYMSPEQAKGEPADHRSDIFSFGVILYEIACGRRPFEGANAISTLHAIAHDDPPPLEKAAPGISRQLASLIESCLAKDKNGRPQSMGEVQSGLAAVLNRTAGAEPRAATRKRTGILVAAVAAIALAAGTVVWRAQQPVSMPRRVLTYTLLAQKLGGEPYEASPGEVFHGGDRFRLRTESPQAGFLYLINEGAGENGRQRFWVLYPPRVPTESVPANHPVETGWNVFDQNPGTERLWILWAEQPLAGIEEALRAAGAGEVRDPAQTGRMRSFLNGLGSAQRTTNAGARENVRVASQEGTLGSLLELRHQ